MKPGRLARIGVRNLGWQTYVYWRCADCRTDYPEIDGRIMCNGASIGRCPYCAPPLGRDQEALRQHLAAWRGILRDRQGGGGMHAVVEAYERVEHWRRMLEIAQ